MSCGCSCGNCGYCAAPSPLVSLKSAVTELHKQAHPGKTDVSMCNQEPCRWLTPDQLRALPLTP